MNISLIGMAGAGKSYLGKKLSGKFGLSQVDSDDLLEKEFGRSIQATLDELGEEKYVQTEADLHIENTKGKDNLLITPAGSVIYSEPWIKHLKDISTIIHVRVPFETIEARLKDLPPRAIIGLDRKTLKELYEERLPLYEKYADFTIDVLTADLEPLFESMEKRRQGLID